MPTELVLDATASMAFPVESRDKWEAARALVVGLASVGHGGGDPVGLRVVTGAGTTRIAAAARRGIVREIAQAVTSLAPMGARSLASAVGDATRAAARVVVVSDFLGDTEPLVALMRAFSAVGGEAYAVHVVAAEELDPGAALRLVSDPEAPEHQRAFGLDERDAYRSAFAEWRDQLAADVRAAGAWYTLVVTGEEPAERAVRRVLAPTAQSVPG